MKRGKPIMRDETTARKLTADEIQSLKDSTGDCDEWIVARTKIEDARGGGRPPDFYQVIKDEGILKGVSWGGI